MLFYEELLAGAQQAGEHTLSESLRAAVVVKVDNVAQFYFEDSPQEDWNLLRDFPNMAPPWPLAFFEYTMPRRLNSEGHVRVNPAAGIRVGVLVQAEEYSEAAMRVSVLQRVQWLAFYALQGKMTEAVGHARAMTELQHVTPEQVWRRLPAAQRQEWLEFAEREGSLVADGAGVRWLVQCLVAMRRPGERLRGPGLRYVVPLSDDGQCIRNPHNPDQVVIMGQRLAGMATDDDDRHIDQAKTWLHVPFLATSFCHCKNVLVRDEAPPPKLAAAQLKRHGIPKVTYKTLEIGPMLGMLQTEGGMAHGHSAQKALHICRGHFMDYREGPGLFGKHHGLYWKDMHVRGRNRQGVVIKDYAVAAPAREA